MQLTDRQQQIIDIISSLDQASISDVKELLKENISQPTLNRDLAKLVKEKALVKSGKARAISYSVSDHYKLFAPVDAGDYFEQEPDKRADSPQFNFEVFDTLKDADLFTKEEKVFLQDLKTEYQQNISDISPTLLQKETERLTIELSWKSSQIEGNTYSLLETEQLFAEKETAKNRTREETVMLLNHKDALDYLIQNPKIGQEISVRLIEEIHSILINELQVARNIRSRSVGITGTAYRPLDNEFQIREHLEKMCKLINARETGFEKALLAVVLISYIQPFEDGNKRTARIIGNALLLADDACPLSYRSVDSLDYKKAMLLFYEQNNLSAFKELFVGQCEFGVKNYFR